MISLRREKIVDAWTQPLTQKIGYREVPEHAVMRGSAQQVQVALGRRCLSDPEPWLVRGKVRC